MDSDEMRTLCSVSQSFPTYNTLLLVLDEFDALCIECFLEFGEVYSCYHELAVYDELMVVGSVLFHVPSAPEKLDSREAMMRLLCSTGRELNGQGNIGTTWQVSTNNVAFDAETMLLNGIDDVRTPRINGQHRHYHASQS
jgi:hypothetical protein